MSSPGVTSNLTCGKGVTELQNLSNLRLSSFAESQEMQQKNFDVSPYEATVGNGKSGLIRGVASHEGCIEYKYILLVLGRCCFLRRIASVWFIEEYLSLLAQDYDFL